MKRPLTSAALLLLLLFRLTGHGQSQDPAVGSQSIPLDAGWNLIAFQVLPEDPSPERVFGTLGDAFLAAWTFDNAAKTWSRFSRTNSLPSGHDQAAPMPRVEFGRAYWVYMDAPVPDWQVSGSAPAPAPPVRFHPGWNLVGLPVGAGELTEPVHMLSVLAASGMDYDVILRWEEDQYDKFTADDGDDDQFSLFDTHRGYWVRLKGLGHTLQPALVSAVRADADIEPQGNYPSYEDLAVSPSPVPLGANNQTHIVFFEGEDSQQLTVANGGGGILLWRVSWEPRDATAIPWLTLSRSLGVVTIENDVILLNLNHEDLVKGVYRGTLKLETSAGRRSFEVVAHVPGLEGEWHGSATIASVNGRKNPLPDIDLHISFFEDPAVPGLLRGLLDSRNALLWPVDVPLIGHSLGDDKNAIALSGGYVLPPGDQNNPPYEAFQGQVEDVDWNCNGMVDAVNPYPFPIYRSVSLNGRLSEASPGRGYILEGTYTEVIYGMLRDSIRLEGAFRMHREQARAFSNRRPVADEEKPDGTQPVVLKTFRPASPRPVAFGKIESSLSFATELVLEGISVSVDLGDVAGETVKLSLVSPGGVPVVLHDRSRKASMRSLRYPEERRPKESLEGLCRAGVSTRGEWKLVVENFGAGVGLLHEWTLRLQGQPVFEFSGRVVDAGTGLALPADVFLDGFPASEVRTTSANGTFTIFRLPGIPLNISAQRSGYEPLDPSMPGLDPSLRTPSFPDACGSASKEALAGKFRPLPILPFPSTGTEGFGDIGTEANPAILSLRASPGLNGAARLLAEPAMGPVPLTVRFVLVAGEAGNVPPGGVVYWDFGDGSTTNGVDLVSVEHTYAQAAPAGYMATARAGAVDAVGAHILGMPSPGHSPNPLNFFQVHLSGGGTIPADYLEAPSAGGDAHQSAALAELIMVQHADCASFDIDRFPFTTPERRGFHLDGFTNGTYRAHPADYAGNFRAEDSNYRVTLVEWELAGDCGYALQDEQYDVHPRSGFFGDCAFERYRMLCNIGPAVVPTDNAEVKAPQAVGLPPPVPDPLLEKTQIAQARGLRMVTGPLASMWKKGSVQ